MLATSTSRDVRKQRAGTAVFPAALGMAIALLGGQIDMMFATAAAVGKLVESGKPRARRGTALAQADAASPHYG